MRPLLAVIVATWCSLSAGADQVAGLKVIQPDSRSGGAGAVIVPDLPLAHTAQLMPEKDGKVISPTAEKQIEFLLRESLPKVLSTAGSEVGQVVKLNLYVAKEEIVPALQHALARQFSGKHKPAVSYVTTALPLYDALVALDAVAISKSTEKDVRWFSPTLRDGPSIFSSAAILPAGPKLYLSGMADTNDLKQAAVKTLAKLIGALGQLGLGESNVVQLKAFLEPMAQAEAVKRELAMFPGGSAPIVFVEWSSKAPNPPIEIELIASAGKESAKESEAVTYLTPAGTTDSKVFRRVARVNHGPLIFISGLYGSMTGSADQQLDSIFEQLGGLAKAAGSDFEHLVKATYYVSDDAAGNKLNEVRPRFYNPQRPPAASKAKVAGVGASDRTVTLDMIAVPAR